MDQAPDMPSRPRRAAEGRVWWRRYARSVTGMAGLATLGGFLVCAIGPGWVTSREPTRMTFRPFSPPGVAHPMGTDDLGRDVLSGVVHGSRASLRIGFLATGITVAIGVSIGALSGFYGGRVDEVLSGLTEWVLVIPRFFLALLLVAIWGASTGNIIIAIGVLSWPLTARLTRAEFLSLKEREFVTAARATGVTDGSLMVAHMLPNALPPIVVNASLEVGNAILLEAAMSFLGLGDPSTTSWGSMLLNAQGFFRRAWWMSVFPGSAVLLVVLSLNLIGDSLNQSLNVRLWNR